jgi:PAS domain S-box-containing protein
MRFFRNISIKKKLSLIALLTCVTALGLASVALLFNEVKVFRRNLLTEVTAQSQMLAGLTTAALTFDDKSAADELLAELGGQKHIDQAFIFQKGRIFASYHRADLKSTDDPAEPKEDGYEFRSNQLILHRLVMMKEKQLGSLILVANTGGLQSRLWQYGLILMGVFLVSTYIALLLASRLQSAIATPVLQLAAAARRVADNQDYSIRAEKSGEDEVGRLTDAFNQMLIRIQQQDTALILAHQKSEALVNSIDGIVWEWNPEDETFTYVSRQSERLLGYQPEQWIGNPTFWDKIIHPEDSERIAKACAEVTDRRKPYSYEYRLIAADKRVVWIRESGVVMVENNHASTLRGIFLDITDQKLAEVATGVLHNVGNVLNSVNVSASLLRENLNKSQIHNLVRATNLLRDHADDTAAFLTTDPKGQRLPEFLIKLGDHIAAEQRNWQQELEGLGKNIEHIKEIVSMQQSYARLAGASEVLDAAELLEDALRINSGALGRHGVTLVREFQKTPPVLVDKHKVLQILINLVRNAKYAMDATGRSDKTLTVAILPGNESNVRIQVRDNGTGIPPENLARIFQHGFTTKKDGHGFGLHSSANAAREMGGNLTAHSDGPDTGATFILELPVSISPARTPAFPHQTAEAAIPKNS